MSKITYHWEGKYLVPDLWDEVIDPLQIGKWASMKFSYMIENQRDILELMWLEDTTVEYLTEIEKQASEMKDRLMKQMKKEAGLTEDMKTNGQWLKYVQTVMMIQEQVEEIIREEIIYNG